MKRIFTILLITVIMSVLLAACSKSNEENHKFLEMDSKTFLKTIALPEKLTIDFSLDEVKKVEKATTYKADFIEFEKERLIDAFIESEIVEEKIWAEGPQVIAANQNTEEMLTVLDGGKAFGIENGVRGGFYYSKSIDGIGMEKLAIVANESFQGSIWSGEHNLNTNYVSRSDLAFEPYEDAYTHTKNILDEAGVFPVKIDETYSLDLKTMKTHYQLFLDRGASVDEQGENLQWTEDDEAYIFYMQQLVDDIPIINKPWEMPDGTKTSAFGNSMPVTEISLVYDRMGIRDMSVYNMVKVQNEMENHSLISVYEALNTLVEAYSLTIMEEDVKIISAELSYLSIPGAGKIELVPGWLFHSVKSEKVDGFTMTKNKYDIVNAVNGKFYEDRW